MNVKKVVSIVVAVLGIVMVVYAIHSMRRISDAKGTVSSINSSIGGSSAGRMVGQKLSSEASQYDTKVRVLLIAGLVFTVAGCGALYRYCNCSHKRRK
jgi:hypothetical protein